MSGDDVIDDNLIEISNFVMYNLNSEFFYNQTISREEETFQRKLKVLYKLPPEAFGVKIKDQMKHAWKLAIKEANRVEHQ